MLHGFQMQLIAAEPLVADPVSITYDEDGRAYVCEMSDYPYTDKRQHRPNQENPTDQPIGKIRLLTDTDGDGVFDKATVFAEGLSWPTGAACWKGGIIVIATPDIWYLKDTDGDGSADVRQKLFTGLRKLNVQAVANNPIWGLDNTITIAGGSNGGTLQDLAHPDRPPFTIRRADLRLDPATMTLEAESGGARFGNTRDDWGNRFLCNIRNPLQHVVVDNRHLGRNPLLPPVNPLVDVAESGDQLPVYRISPPEQWRELRAQRWSVDTSINARMPRSELVGAGVVTSSSGVTVYRGDAYPPEYRGQAFVADVAGNLFYRLGMKPQGVTFTAARIDGNKEFVASRDIWFRPVNFTNAPDGCLHVCDMYREAIEHPWSLPDDIHAALDLENGRDKGRLYRLAPPGFKPRPAPQLSKASTAELVRLLEHPNAWHRDTAHRLLFERQDAAAVPLLREVLESRPNPLARVEALWVLEGMKQIGEAELSAALKSDAPELREHALLIASRKPHLSGRFVEAVNEAASDQSVRVRFLAALFLTDTRLADNIPSGLVQLAKRDGADQWMRSAILTSPRNSEELFDALVRADNTSPAVESVVADLAAMIPRQEKGAQSVAAASRILNATLASPHLPDRAKRNTLLALAPEVAKAGQTFSTLTNEQSSTAWLRKWREDMRAMAGDSAAELDTRQTALKALNALMSSSELRSLLVKLLHPAEPDALRVSAIRFLGQQRDMRVAAALIEAWPTLTPQPREAAAQVLTARPAWTETLMSAIETGTIKPAEISALTRAALQRITTPALKERVERLFSSNINRSEMMQKYQAALAATGNTEAGRKIYEAACAVCHVKGSIGRDVGPNLATVVSWTPEQLLTNILDPNREVSPNFLLYTLETTDGRTFAGLITAETAGNVSLKGADGVEQTVARREMKSLRSTGVSLMPEGLEGSITPQQMADLIAFLRN